MWVPLQNMFGLLVAHKILYHMETNMLLADVRIHERNMPQKGQAGFKNNIQNLGSHIRCLLTEMMG